MSNSPQSETTRSRAYWVAGVLFAFAVVLWLDPLPFAKPVPAAVQVQLPDWVTDTTPIRQPDLQPEYETAVYTYRCSECHRIIPPPAEVRRQPVQHREIVLAHGINTHCLNCHHPTNRDAFVDDRGDEIPWDQPQQLCAKCHGPVYRDWQNGSHGRTNGFWDTTQGTQARRKCIECHDPHRPPFPSMHAAPGPHTLRMGPQDHDEHPDGHDPLRFGSRTSRTSTHGTGDAAEKGH